MSDTLARISRIQKFCTHDGPGVRTTVFLKGCPLRCAWCHNPEMRSAKPAVLFARRLCVGCGACESVCDHHVHAITDTHSLAFSQCVSCEKCAEICPTGALEMDSTLMTVEQVMAEVLRDRVFYGASGGLTLSGGEPMFQAEVCLALLRAAKAAGITTAIETCGFFDSKYIPALAAVTDTFLWDFKDSDARRHQTFTGHSNERGIQNLLLLDSFSVRIILRCILVESVNITSGHSEAIAELFHSLTHCSGVELLPYHAYGVSKAEQAGIAMEPHREWIPSAERVADFAASLIAKGVPLVSR